MSEHCTESNLKIYFNKHSKLMQQWVFTGPKQDQDSISAHSALCIHAASVLAASGHSGDKSGEVSLGNGLQKRPGS